MRRILTWALWLILIVGIGAVAYFAWQYFTGDEQPENEQVILVCSEECAERGQCGTSQGEIEAPVVLGGRNGPVVEPQQHDAAFLAGTSAELKESAEVTLVEDGGREFKQTFSRIEFVNPMGDIAESGWVADWCIERP